MNRLTILPLWKNVTSVAFSIRFVVYDMVVSFHVHLITDYSHFNTIFTNETTIKVHFSSPAHIFSTVRRETTIFPKYAEKW